MTSVVDLEALHHTDQRAVRTVDSLADEQWYAPSLLPGWTRAHVVAHLALNAEGFAGALDALTEDDVVPIYPSNRSRDEGIEELAIEDPSTIRRRFFAATQHFRNVAATLTPAHWAATVLRVPDGPAWPAVDLVGARQREVEIHHADLGLAYTHKAWPSEFAAALLDQVTGDHADSPDSPNFAVHAFDLNRTWTVGASTPVISGATTDLGWWLVGRGQGEGLTADRGRLPVLGPWRRSPLR